MTPHDAWKFAEALAGSGMLPRQYQNNPASVLWALEYGRAIGLDVITTTQSVHVIQGRATASADLMASLTRRAGHRMRISGDDTRAEVTIFRADDPEFPFTAVWDIAKATRAKLTGKDTWKQFPGAMLRARAISECVRMACPEVLHGSIYTPEEIGANVDADGMPVEAEVHQLRRVQPGEADQWCTPTPAAEPTISPEQSFADAAGTTKNQAAVKEMYKQAHAAGLLAATVKVGEESQELGAYLIARGQELAQPAPQRPDPVETGPAPYSMSDAIGAAGGIDGAFTDDGPDVEVVAEGETEADKAERELRAAAQAAGLDNLDEEFERSYGLPIAQAGAQQMRQMTAILTGSAA
jgi:hypothetical protein